MSGPVMQGASIAELVSAPPGYWAEGHLQNGESVRVPVAAFAHVWYATGNVRRPRFLALIPDPDGCGLVVAESLGFTCLHWDLPRAESMQTWASDAPQ